jgi:PAS domain S-box-containing protein
MPAGNTSLRVFIVEDEPSIAAALRVQLGLLGYPEPRRAEDRQSALAMVAQEKPDLVIMDVQLAQGDDGALVALELREKYQVPSIFLTSHTDDDTLARCKRAEPAGYLLKPFSLQQLKVSLEMALHREAVIRARREAEEQRQRSESLFRAIFDHTPVALLSTDDAGLVVTANPAAISLFQRSAEEFVGCDLRQLLSDAIPAEDGVVNQTTTLRLDDGRLVPVSVCAVRFSHGGERLTNYFFSDLRARLALEHQLGTAQDSDALAATTAVIAHDLNNMLGSLQTLQFLIEHEQGSPSLASGEALGHMVSRGSLLSEQLFQLSQLTNTSASKVNVQSFLAESLPLFRSVLGGQHTLLLQANGSYPDLCISPQHLRQTLLQLLRNAKSASRPGTPVYIEVECGSPGEVDITVRDEGHGIPVELQAQVFEPFFSTRTGSHGLGLAIVNRTVTGAGGHVRLDSTQGRGTSVVLRLPSVR